MSGGAPQFQPSICSLCFQSENFLCVSIRVTILPLPSFTERGRIIVNTCSFRSIRRHRFFRRLTHASRQVLVAGDVSARRSSILITEDANNAVGMDGECNT